MIGLNKIGLNQVQLNRLHLNAPFPAYGKMAGGGGSGDGFPQLPGDVTRWHFRGLTNEMMAAMDDPRIEDADHKGRFLSFKNFAWGGMSGVGGYGDENHLTFYKFTFDDYVFIAIKAGVKHMNFTFRVTGLQPGNKLTLAFFGTTNTVYGTWDKDGIYTVNSAVVEVGKPVYFYNGYGATRGEFTIEILPLYPGALVFDGVDDYGICENFPILTKEKGYTVVALRQWIEEKNDSTALVSNCKNWGQDGAFLFEYNNLRINFLNVAISFGHVSSVDRGKSPFSYQTSKLYNGKNIEPGSFIGSNELVVGKGNKDFPTVSKVAIWELIILDHDATEEELTKIKNYFIKTYPWLFFDQAWTVPGKTNEDEDRATIANITGNGNDLVLSNFGFAEGSGYGLYAQNYISYAITNRAVYTKTNSSIHVTKSITAGVNFTESARDVTIPSYRIKVTGIQSGQEMIYRGSNNTFLTNIPSDGIYVLPAVENGSNLGFQFVSYTGDCDITIEQIPEYEGYLITDGVDDEIISAKLIQFADKFTIVGDWKFMEDRNDNAGLLKANQIYIYNATTGMRIYLKQGSKNYPFSCKKINALTSDGWVYDEKWDKYKVYPIGSDIDISSRLFLGFYSSNFTKIALKNLGIYNDQLLSKDDCIKAYNYLQTLKAK